MFTLSNKELHPWVTNLLLSHQELELGAAARV